MYYPYFFSNQFELEVIFRLKREIDQGKILPIIEPYNASKSVVREIRKVISSETKIILIINPPHIQKDENDRTRSQNMIESLLNQNANIILGINIGSKSLEIYKNIIETYPTREIALFHNNNEINPIEIASLLRYENVKYNFFSRNTITPEYHQHFKETKKIILHNAFIRQSLNKKYKEHLDEFFYSLHKEYKHLGFDGFGDYLTIGDQPSDKKQPKRPSTIVIHYTYPTTSTYNQINIRRFIATIDKEKEKTQVGIYKAMIEAKRFILEHTSLHCSLCSECKDLIQKVKRKEPYNLLGEIKKFSMLHHVYMIMKLMD